MVTTDFMHPDFQISNPANEFYNFLNKYKGESTEKISLKEFEVHFQAYLNLMDVVCKDMKWGKLEYKTSHIENNLFANGQTITAYYKLHILAINKSAYRIYEEIKPITKKRLVCEYFPLLMEYCADSCQLIQDATNHYYKVNVSYGLHGINTSTTFEIYKAASITLRGSLSEKYIGSRLIYKVSVFFIRQALELRLNKILGIYLPWDKKKNRPIKIHLTKDILKLMEDNSNNIILPVSISKIKNIYSWTNWYIHAGIHAPEYITEWALNILKPLFSSGHHKNFQSIHGSVKIKKSFYASAVAIIENGYKNKSEQYANIKIICGDNYRESIVVNDDDWKDLISSPKDGSRSIDGDEEMMEHQHDHSKHKPHAHEPSDKGDAASQPSRLRLSVSATLHCLLGCGLGEVLGMVIGVGLSMSTVATIVLAVILGFVFGFLLGLIPLIRAGFSLRRAFRQVAIAETLSIAVMETAEILVQVYTPGVMEAGLSSPLFWFGMLLALIAGFAAAFPVNYIMIGRGVRHVH